MENKKLEKGSQAFPSLLNQLPQDISVDASLKGSFQQLHRSFHGNQEFLGLFHWHILRTINHKFYGKGFNDRFFL